MKKAVSIVFAGTFLAFTAACSTLETSSSGGSTNDRPSSGGYSSGSNNFITSFVTVDQVNDFAALKRTGRVGPVEARVGITSNGSAAAFSEILGNDFVGSPLDASDATVMISTGGAAVYEGPGFFDHYTPNDNDQVQRRSDTFQMIVELDRGNRFSLTSEDEIISASGIIRNSQEINGDGIVRLLNGRSTFVNIGGRAGSHGAIGTITGTSGGGVTAGGFDLSPR